MGRKNLSTERREDILEAMATCVDEHGLTGSTMARVAKQLGVHRTLVCHYFGTRDILIEALIERQIRIHTESCLTSLESLQGADRLAGIIDYLFDGALIAADDLVFQGEIYSLAGRDKSVRTLVHGMYQSFMLVMNNELDQLFPQAPKNKREQIAYNLICLAEQNCVMHWLGLNEAKAGHAQAGAELLLKTLGKTAS